MTSSNRHQAVWLRRPERSNKLMLRIMVWISLRFGRSAGRIVLHLIAIYFLLFAPSSREGSRAYLRRILNRPVRLRDIYKHFFWFGSTVHDRIYLLNGQFHLFDIRVVGDELMKQATADGKGVFLFGAHMGSFEVIRSLGRDHAGLRVAMAMYEENARKINDMLAAVNPSAQQDIIGLGHLDSMLKIHERMNQGTLVGMLADRTLSDDVMHPVTFLGSPAHLPLGPFRMAAILRQPVIFMTGLYLGDNRYEIHFEKLADFSAVSSGERQAEMQRAMERYTGLLERYCRHAPYNWFNFFDFWHTARDIEKKD